METNHRRTDQPRTRRTTLLNQLVSKDQPLHHVPGLDPSSPKSSTPANERQTHSGRNCSASERLELPGMPNHARHPRTPDLQRERIVSPSRLRARNAGSDVIIRWATRRERRRAIFHTDAIMQVVRTADCADLVIVPISSLDCLRSKGSAARRSAQSRRLREPACSAGQECGSPRPQRGRAVATDAKAADSVPAQSIWSRPWQQHGRQVDPDTLQRLATPPFVGRRRGP
jgi:hypothetical protein